MGKGRSLLTDREREILRNGKESEEYSENRWYNVRHRVRERVEELPADLEILREHYPEIYADLVEAVEREIDSEQEQAPT